MHNLVMQQNNIQHTKHVAPDESKTMTSTNDKKDNGPQIGYEHLL
jgi:hypothetical protein